MNIINYSAVENVERRERAAAKPRTVTAHADDRRELAAEQPIMRHHIKARLQLGSTNMRRQRPEEHELDFADL